MKTYYEVSYILNQMNIQMDYVLNFAEIKYFDR